MNILTIILLVLAAILVFEFIKHHLTKKIGRLILVLVIFFVVILIISSYLTSNKLIEPENKFVVTGLAIFGGAKEKIEKSEIMNTTKKQNTFDND